MQTEQLARPGGAIAAGPVPVVGRRRWVWLGIGTLLSLFAAHSNYDIALAAWLFPVFLMRFVRTGPVLTGVLALWAAALAGGLYRVFVTGVEVNLVTALGLLLLSTVLFVPFALDRLFAGRVGTAGSLVLFPAAMAAIEFLVTTVSPFGSTLAVSAPSQHENLALLQVMALTGPYGVAFLVGGFATVVNHVWASGRDHRRWVKAVGAYSAVLAVALLTGGARMAFAPPDGPTVRAAGISPDTSATDDLTRSLGVFSGATAQDVAGRDPASVRPVFEQVTQNVLARTGEAAEAGAKIVFWSEQSANVLAADEQAFLGRVAATAREHRIYLQAAAAIYLPQAPYAANRTYLFDPDGSLVWTYNKAHPIPGLEFYPPSENAVPVVQTPYGRLASVICFDADFPAQLRVDADIMIVPARDWAGVSSMHSRMAKMRVVENGYSMIRQAEFGVSGAFDSQGRTLTEHVYERSDQHVVISDVPVRGTATPYRSIGDVFAWGCAAVTVALIGLAVRRARRPENPAEARPDSR